MSITGNAIGEDPIKYVDSVTPVNANQNEVITNNAKARIAAESGEDNSGIFINVYPNPTTGQVAWKLLTDEPTSINLVLYNSLGGEQLNENSPNSTQVHEGVIDLYKFNTGIYFLKFNVGAKTLFRKIMKN